MNNPHKLSKKEQKAIYTFTTIRLIQLLASFMVGRKF